MCSGKITGLALAFMTAGLFTVAALANTQRPRRVLVVGDSMMRATSQALQREVGAGDGIELKVFTSLGSGLARLDVFDWMAKLDELAESFNPDVVLAWFGANDRQPMKIANGVVRPGDPAWDEEYASRTGRAMDILTTRRNTRLYWLELPDMRDNRQQEDVAAVNRLVEQAASGRAKVTIVPTRTLLSRQPGRYSPFIIGSRGLPLQIREADGIHLNRAGADMMAGHLRALLNEMQGPE